MIMPALLLQKPSKVSKSKDHTAALKRRLAIWQRGDFLELLHESETIQKRMKASVPMNNIEAVSKKFASLMKAGKLNAAVKLLTNSMEGGILPLNTETMTLLQTKHPGPAEFSEEAVVDIEPVEIHPVIIEEINSDAVRTAALNTRGGLVHLSWMQMVGDIFMFRATSAMHLKSYELNLPTPSSCVQRKLRSQWLMGMRFPILSPLCLVDWCL